MEVLFTLLVVILLIFIWIWIYDLTHFEVTQFEVFDERIQKDVKAVVLADLHNHQYGRKNQILIEAIDALKPDVVLVAGDMITAKPGNSIDIGMSLLRELSATYPVLYGNGNHELRLKLYPKYYGERAKELAKACTEAGIMVLDNKSLELSDTGICVYGLDAIRDFYVRRNAPKMETSYLEQELGQCNPQNYNVLLAHNPDYFESYASWGADLSLSGHVHGGLVRIPIWKRGVLSPRVRFFPKYSGGLYTTNQNSKEATMIVSRGLGCHTLPIRLFNQGELVEVQFHPKKNTEE